MTEQEAFTKTVSADPGDRVGRLALADWLDERGDHRTAYALRWMVRHGKNPAHWDGGVWEWLWDRSKPWVSKCRRRMPIVGCWIPEIVGREMASRFPTRSRRWFVLVKRLGWALQRIRELV